MKQPRAQHLPSWIPSASRVLSFLWAGRIALQAGGIPEVVLFYDGGLGDDILCTAVARELKKRGAGTIWLLTAFAELFRGNPDVVAVPRDYRVWRFCEVLRRRCVRMQYPDPPPLHLIATLCRSAGLAGTVDLRPYIFVSSLEKQAGKVYPCRQVAIQTSSMSARFPMLNKQWPTTCFQEVVDVLKQEFNFVQIGSPSDPALSGVLDLRGTGIRRTAAILASSDVFVGLVGGLMHLARAVDCRSVIIYGGREHPAQSGYSANENIYWQGPCSPCWLRNTCDNDRVCLREILPEAVVTAVQKQARDTEATMGVEQVEI